MTGPAASRCRGVRVMVLGALHRLTGWVPAMTIAEEIARSVAPRSA